MIGQLNEIWQDETLDEAHAWAVEYEFELRDRSYEQAQRTVQDAMRRLSVSLQDFMRAWRLDRT